jgi:hypothetical protein
MYGLGYSLVTSGCWISNIIVLVEKPALKMQEVGHALTILQLQEFEKEVGTRHGQQHH